MDEALEAEDFQAVGMRCRECLIAMVLALAAPEMVPENTEAPKRADVVQWCELISNHIAKGAGAEFIRKHMKSVSRSAWQLANWLTHTTRARSR